MVFLQVDVSQVSKRQRRKAPPPLGRAERSPGARGGREEMPKMYGSWDTVPCVRKAEEENPTSPGPRRKVAQGRGGGRERKPHCEHDSNSLSQLSDHCSHACMRTMPPVRAAPKGRPGGPATKGDASILGRALPPSGAAAAHETLHETLPRLPTALSHRKILAGPRTT
jgi:hypothetical protein